MKIAGRAVGSAREILGLRPAKPAKDSTSKRGRGRPKGSKNKPKPGRRSRQEDNGAINDLVSTLESLQKERDDAIATLDEIRTLLAV